MSDQRRRGKYPDELRERAVRMVYEAERDCASRWEAISSVAHKLGPTPETVRKWVRRMEVESLPERIQDACAPCKHRR